MAIDITLLRVMKHRQDYERLRRAIPERAIDGVTKTLLDDYGLWFKQHADAKVIDMDSFPTWVKLAHPKLPDDKLSLLAAHLRRAKQDVEPEVRAGIVEQLATADSAIRMNDLLDQWSAGEDVDLFRVMHAEVERLSMNMGKVIKEPWVEDDIDDLMDEDFNDTGLHWRLPELNAHMRPLRGGDFIIVAARVDAGKTSFLTDNLTYMAPQIEGNRGVIWFNNEGPGKRIKGRLYQSALNATFPELQEMRQRDNEHRKAYAAALGGNEHAIRIVDCHDWYNHDVEDIIKKHRPGLVVFDMLDNLRFGGEAAHGGQRTDQFLEAMYQWARVCSVKYDCPIIATSQVSADGAGLQYPGQHMLKDSKTGKQGAAEAIIMVGKSSDVLLAGSRFISTPKNKLARPGMPSELRAEVEFDGSRGRFTSPE